MKAYGIGPDENPTDNFVDANETVYSGYLAAAKRLGIVSGVGNNRFAPNQTVTRQEVFVMLYNILNAIGKLPEKRINKPLSVFSDENEIASWAREAIAALVEAEIISGYNGKLNPRGYATKAEMAQLLYNLIS